MVSMFLNYYDICAVIKLKRGKRLKYKRIPLLAIKMRAISKPGLSFILPTKGREHASDPQEQKLHPLYLEVLRFIILTRARDWHQSL